MERGKYIAYRFGLTLVSIWAVITLLFLLFRLAPGDPTSRIIEPGMDAAARQRLLESYGMHEPLHVQYIYYLSNVMRGDLGVSFTRNAPVMELIIASTLNTLVLIIGSLIIAYSIGPVIGAYAAWHRGKTVDRYGVLSMMVVYSAPLFWTGMLGLMLFSFTLGWVPSGGMISARRTPDTFLEAILSIDFLRHLALPFFLAVVYWTVQPALIMRNTMVDVLGSDFIEMNRAQGLSELKILYRHAARNSLLPVLHASAISIGFALGGSVVFEEVFSWPGVGRMLWRAIEARDYPLAQGGFLMIAVLIITLNFIADVLSVYLDPRAAQMEEK